MPDPKKPEIRVASDKMSDIVDSQHKGKFTKANTLLNEFKVNLSEILENGWTDAKEDLPHPGKSLESR